MAIKYCRISLHCLLVLLFLLSLLVHARSRRRMLLVGSTFVLISGIIYFLFMAAWLNLFLVIGSLPYITLIAGLLALLIGVTVYSLLTNIPLPWVGTVVYAIGIFLGLGAIMLHARQLYQRMQRASYPVATGPGTSAAPELPAPRHTPGLDVLLGNAPEPPPDSGDPLGPGMTNLPDGFEIDWLGKEGPKRG